MERVGRDDDPCRAVCVADLSGELGREVLGDDLDTLLARKLGDVPRRVDPERPAAPCVEEREEEPVVAADVDRQRLRRIEEALRRPSASPAKWSCIASADDGM